MDLKKLIIDYLEHARLMQVATSKDNQPWVCSVYFAYDDELNLYWLSKLDRRHSLEIEQNEKVAGTIVLPHTPGDKVRGLQFAGIAKKLVGEELKQGLNVYAKRMGTKEEKQQSILDGTLGHTIYKIKPSVFVLFDEQNFLDNPRQEFML